MSGEPLSTRPFAAGRLAFVVETASAEDRDLIETVFADLPLPEPDEDLATFQVLREPQEGEVIWQMSGPRIDGAPSTSVAAVLVRLVSAVNLASLDADPEGLHLHAGAVARDGHLIIVAAERNTGKTTTVAHLVARGWDSVTDETVRLSNRAAFVEGLPKPMSIKPGGWRLIEHFKQHLYPPVTDGDTSESFRFVPVGASGADVVAAGSPQLVVLLRRPADGDEGSFPRVRLLRPADAVVALMQETLDAEHFGEALEELSALASSCRCIEVTLGSPEAAAACIEEEAEKPPQSAGQWSRLPHSERTPLGVVSVTIADGAVVHDTNSGRIFALDAAGARVWEHLGGWAHHNEIESGGLVVEQFASQLRSLGVLSADGDTRLAGI